MTSQPTGYEEAHSALNWRLLACGLFAPGVAEIMFLILAITVNPQWVIAMVFLPAFVPVLVYISLVYRNWPTGIRIDQSGISIGAIRPPRSRHRTPTVSHQAWGLFTCPWSGVTGIQVVTDPEEIARLSRSPDFHTFTNRWSSKPAMKHCNLGVLSAPFMRAALVIDVLPSAITATKIRPATFYSNFRNGYFRRRVPPMTSLTWVVPTRHPEALSQAIVELSRTRDRADS